MGDQHHHSEDQAPFPRAAAAELIGEEFERRGRRELVQALVLAAGILLLALAFPTTGLYGRVLDLVGNTEHGRVSSTSLLGSGVATVLQAATGLAAESCWFLISALAFGLSVVPLLGLARDRGWERGPALFAVLAALASPLVLVAGTLPDAAALQLLGAAFAVRALASERAGAALQAVTWMVAVLLHATLLWAWPALIAARVLAPPGRQLSLRRCAAPVFALVALVILVVAIHAANGDLARALHSWTRELLAGGSGGPGPALAWWTLWPLGLGASGLGLAAFAAHTARAGNRGRELALVLFALVPWCAFSLGGALDWELPWLWLVPLGVLGLLELLQLAEERGHGSRARLASLALALLGWVGALWIRGLDTQARWTAQASVLLEPGDVVLSSSPEHGYLLHHRFHVETLDLREVSARAASERQAFWFERIEQAADLRRGGRRIVLDEDSLHTWGTLAWPLESEISAFMAAAQPVRLPRLAPEGAR